MIYDNASSDDYWTVFFAAKADPIFNFTKNTDREDLRTDLSFFLVDPHNDLNDLPILSEII